MGEVKLLPCPLCGRHSFVHYSDPGYIIWCSTDRCLKLPPRETEAEAIAAWNTRADSDVIGKLVEALETSRDVISGAREHMLAMCAVNGDPATLDPGTRKWVTRYTNALNDIDAALSLAGGATTNSKAGSRGATA